MFRFGFSSFRRFSFFSSVLLSPFSAYCPGLSLPLCAFALFSYLYEYALACSCESVYCVLFQVSIVETKSCGSGPICLVTPQGARLAGSSLHICLQSIYKFVILTAQFVIIMLVWSIHMTYIACLSILGEGSLLCCSSWGFLHISPLKGEFFLLRIKAVRIEGVVCCTDCEAPEAHLWFVILGYIKLTWLDYLSKCTCCLPRLETKF